MARTNKILPVGIIDIGAHSVRLEVSEIRKNEAPKLLESLNRPLNLGHDVFASGAVSPEKLQGLTGILRDFKKLLGEYQIFHPRVVGTSAIREATNRELVLSRVRDEAGVEIEIIEPQKEAELYFLAMRELLTREGFHFGEMTGIVLIVGTGSVFLLFFENGVLKFCEGSGVGTVRIYDEAGENSSVMAPGRIVERLEHLDLKQRLIESVGLDGTRKMTIVAMGEGVRFLAGQSSVTAAPVLCFSPEEMRARIDDYMARSAAAALAYAADSADFGMASCCNLLKFFLSEFRCENFISPMVSTRSALIA
ncbi:MAG: hypothetical protein PHS41_09230, partial [Victivallaceae bacterium]|nr:hypothetical protein [Victivallaceae bacterium]